MRISSSAGNRLLLLVALLVTATTHAQTIEEVIMAFTPAVSSTNSRLFQSIENATRERHPGSRVLSSVSTGFTDSHFTRDLVYN